MSCRYGQIYSIRWNGGSYVGQSKSGSMARWARHVALLKASKHHNDSLQRAYYTFGLCGLSFSVLETDVFFDDLDDREAAWTERLGSVNAITPRKVREERADQVLELINSGRTYREISKEMGVSLGTVSYIKQRYG